jgi:hypothetical protein
MIRSAHSVSDSHSAVASMHVASFYLLMLSLLVALAPQLAATVIVSTDINANSIGIVPSSGMVVFQQPWTAQVYAQAQNSLGQFDAHFDISVGGVAQTEAMVAFADAEAEAMAPRPYEKFANSHINAEAETIRKDSKAIQSDSTLTSRRSSGAVYIGIPEENTRFCAIRASRGLWRPTCIQRVAHARMWVSNRSHRTATNVVGSATNQLSE